MYATFVNTEDWTTQKIGISASRPYLIDLPILYWIKGNDFFTQVPPSELAVIQIWKTRLRWTTLYPLHILSQEYWVGKAGFHIGRVALLLGTAMRKEERGRNNFITISTWNEQLFGHWDFLKIYKNGLFTLTFTHASQNVNSFGHLLLSVSSMYSF